MFISRLAGKMRIARLPPPFNSKPNLQEMLTHWGFTWVWDLGSNPQNTLTIPKRVESGEVPGPMDPDGRRYFPEKRPSRSICRQRCNFRSRQRPRPKRTRKHETTCKWDWTASSCLPARLWATSRRSIWTLRSSRLRSTWRMHRANRFFTHPQNRVGQDNAVAGGVDVLAHTIPTEGALHDIGTGRDEAPACCPGSNSDALDSCFPESRYAEQTDRSMCGS